ncbi:biosynthetic peptidoglycan transglycosylase [Olivibacter sp. XZL3]|uniref:biosynthetic peptidoglycan transglycosylase n=1 Tax=Olivibacter sp. XZL3 TaxID=1735116 RepID=UPI0010652A78|nr:biosynthetic peptidoglycan transglycosylase [Olivibacter sp. XZL3]
MFKKIHSKHVKIALIAVGGILVVSAVVLGIIYYKRAGLLQEALQQIKERAKTEYDLDVSIDDAYFSAFSTVTFENFRVQPNQRAQLLDVEYLDVTVELWPLLAGNVKVSALNLHDAKLSFVKKDSLSNYDFLFKQKQADTVRRQADMNLAELADKLINSVLYKVPENMKLAHFEATYLDDSTKQTLSVPKAIIDDGNLSSTVEINGKEAIWHVLGKVQPKKKQLYFKVYAEGKAVELPIIKRKYGLTLKFDTLETDLRNVVMDRGELQVSGGLAAKNLIVQHWRISEQEIAVPRTTIDAKVLVGESYISLDKSSEVKIKQLSAHPFGKLSFRPHRTVEAGVLMPEIEAQDMFDSFPQGMFDNLEGIRVSGKLKYHLDLFVDLDNPDSVRLSAGMDKKDFRINSWGKTNLAKINTPFIYTAYEDGKAMRSIHVSPENPNFTPLDQIAPVLKNAVLTAEDPSFFSHKGFVEDAFKASITANLKAKAFKRGGSTISMQLVKNVYLGREKTLARKIEEILMVWLIENNRVVSKSRMFEVYLNIIEWGRNVYGIGEASRFYFGKHPSQLNLGESIYLASIIPKPKTGLYPFLWDGHLKPYLGGYFRLIGGIMARRGLVPRDSSSYGFYDVRLREALRPARPDTLQTDTIKRDLLEQEFEEAKSFLEKLFGKDKKQEQ